MAALHRCESLLLASPFVFRVCSYSLDSQSCHSVGQSSALSPDSSIFRVGIRAPREDRWPVWLHTEQWAGPEFQSSMCSPSQATSRAFLDWVPASRLHCTPTSKGPWTNFEPPRFWDPQGFLKSCSSIVLAWLLTSPSVEDKNWRKCVCVWSSKD